MAAALKALRVTQSPHDVRTGSHTPRDDPELTSPCAYRSLSGDQHFLSEVLLARRVVVVTVHSNATQLERANFLMQHSQYRFHHDPAIFGGIILCPLHCLDVVVEVLGSLHQVGKITIGQVDEVALHVLTRQLDVCLTDEVPDTARTGVEHYPDGLLGVQADLDKVISATQSAQLGLCVLCLQTGRFVLNCFETASESPPPSNHGVRHIRPRALVAAPPNGDKAVRNRAFDFRANRAE